MCVMTSDRVIGAVSKLSGVAVEYPELAGGITTLISGLLQREADNEFTLDPLPRRAVRCNGTHNRLAGVTIIEAVAKQWYNVHELAEIVDRSSWTVSRWCVFGRIAAEKVKRPAPGLPSWRIHASEVDRIRSQWIMPFCTFKNS